MGLKSTDLRDDIYKYFFYFKVSIGMGRYEPLLIDPYEQANDDSNILTLKDKFSKLVLSATDTEMTHVTLHDLLPDNKYFRFNPYLSGKFWKIHFSFRKPVG